MCHYRSAVIVEQNFIILSVMPKKASNEKNEMAAITPKESVLVELNPYEVRNTGGAPSDASCMAPARSLDSNETELPMLKRVIEVLKRGKEAMRW